MKFSQRIGIPAKAVQLDSMDDELRVKLWNMYSMTILAKIKKCNPKIILEFIFLHWHDLFGLNVDKMPRNYDQVKITFSTYFKDTNSIQWFKIYELIEYSLAVIKDNKYGIDIDSCYNLINQALISGNSGFRVINGIVSPITNEHEKLEIENVLNISSNFTALNGCNIHLSQSLKMMSDKINPDYRNSIKESISAVESVAKIVAGSKGSELAKALKILQSKANINGGLVAGFNSIYGWTSSSDGIRHGLMDEPTCDFEDAKYMLVSSSAFINYIIGKAQKSGILLK